MEVALHEVFRGIGYLAFVGAVLLGGVRSHDEHLPIAHDAAHHLLRDLHPTSFEHRPDAPIAEGAIAGLEQGSHLFPKICVLVGAQARAVVLIGALRYLQETYDRSEGQACRQPQSLA